MRKATLLLTAVLSFCLFTPSRSTLAAQERTSLLLDYGWKFRLLDDPSMKVEGVMDDTGWRTLDIPHDYQMELPWERNGSAARGFKGFTDACYQKHFRADEAWKGRKVVLDFEGVMTSAVIWINGHRLGEIDYGYLGAEFDISRYVKYDDENIVTVLSILADGGKSR